MLFIMFNKEYIHVKEGGSEACRIHNGKFSELEQVMKYMSFRPHHREKYPWVLWPTFWLQSHNVAFLSSDDLI